MSGEITLDVVLQRLESSGIKDRSDCLKDLTHVLRNNSKLDTLSDGAFHKIFRVLFGIAVAEQSMCIKGKPASARTAENRLSSCASALRLTVEVGNRHIRLKTVRSVLDHVIDTIILANGQLCEPIALDYVKCLRSLLSYRPHVEHLSDEDREKTVAFCVKCIKLAQASTGDDDAMLGAELTSHAGTITALSYRSSRSNLNQTGGSQGSKSLPKSIAEQTVACLSLLTSAPNAAPGSGASELLTILIAALQDGSITSGSRQDAFSTINHILVWTRTENIELTAKVANSLVRLIRYFWTAKTSFDKALSAFRDEMLTTIIYLRPYLIAAMHQSDSHSIRAEIIGLVDVMRNEYSRRAERDQLRLEDLRLIFCDPNAAVRGEISTALFRLRCVGSRAEANWTILYMLASLLGSLMGEKLVEDSSDVEDQEDDGFSRPRKRQRITDEFEDVTASSTNGATTSRVCALQTLTFLAQQRRFSSKQLTQVADKLSVSCADDNGLISSWAMLALTSLASQSQSTKQSLTSRWLSIWQIVTRAMSNVSTCRAACYLIHLMIKMRLVPQQNVSELVQTITYSMDLNGPSLLADSILCLMAVTINASQRISPASSNATAESILGWLFRNYRPSKFNDREHASQYMLFEPEDVILLISCCLGQHSHFAKASRLQVWQGVGLVWLECTAQEDLIAYLLLLPESPPIIDNSIPDDSHITVTTLPRPNCETVTLNHLITETSRAQEEWGQLIREKPQAISSDIFASHCNSSFITTCIAFCSLFRDSRRQDQLQAMVKDSLRAVGDFISSQHSDQEKTDAMLITFSSVCHGLLWPDTQIEHPNCEQQICRLVSRAFAAKSVTRNFNDMKHEDDDMDLDVPEDSQDSRQNGTSTDEYCLSSECAAKFSYMSLRANMMTYATTMNAFLQSRHNHAESHETASSAIIDYLLSLPEISMLLSLRVISSLSDIGVELNVDDCYRLFDHCADRILWPYTYERNEVVLASVLKVMTSFTAVLTDEKNQSLYNLGIDMYNWYTSVALRAGVLSPVVQEGVANLLLRICHVDTDYGRDDEQNVPSVRTSLFRLVQLGSIKVKFALATRISTIFGLFVLSNHSAMFDDLQMSLPEESEWLEGMAMRLLFLSKLASAWHSLLRQCVYYIFETAGSVKSSSKHATRSMAELAKALKFSTPQRLFQLFAPQLLYTWLQHSTVSSLPFSVFDYDTLKALIEKNEGEIVAQLLVSGNDRGLQAVLDATKLSSKELVTRNFAKCEAYCLSWDITHSSTGPNDATCENRLRMLLKSKEEHKALVNNQFAAIMGYLYLSLQQDDAQDGWLDKRPGYGTALKALAEMKAFNHSERTLPTSQEPCFKDKYLCDEIERLCRRTAIDPVKPWEQDSFAQAARMLLDSIENALGPLHTCLVMRKLRLLISMAGDVAFSGFPLEMLVHTLRPFLADSQSADDVMGILQYLFDRGKSYLQTNTPFLYGTVVLIVLQMRKHAGARLDSTTQESQHKSTVQKMQKFQSWLVNYLENLRSVDDSPHSSVYASITESLKGINLPGNARKGSLESTLLLSLLGAESSSEAAIRPMDRREALLLLADNFEVPPSISEDCLGNDTDCARLSQSLMSLIQIPGLSEAFKEWAANGLGRAYAYTGIRPLMPSNVQPYQLSQRSSRYEGIARSQATIAARLSENLFSRNRFEASLADYTLRSVLDTFHDNEELITFQQMLPPAVVTALSGGTYGYEPFHISDSAFKTFTLHDVLEPNTDTTLESWAKSLSLILCQGALKIPIFPALTVALQNSASLALEFLPCMIHILLLHEFEREPIVGTALSASMAQHFANDDVLLLDKRRFFIELILYLREQPFPAERTHADRLRWLEVDWLTASEAAQKCGLPSAALLFIESSSSPTQGGRRASSRASLTQLSIAQVPQDLVLSIFKSVEEPDSFYGVEQPSTLESVLERLDYEADGYKSLMFRSAQTDTHIRSDHQITPADNAGIIRSLSMLNLNSITFALLTGGTNGTNSPDALLKTARQLQRWDIMPAYESSGATSNSFSIFQELSRANDCQIIQRKLRSIMQGHIEPVATPGRSRRLSHDWYSNLASFTEISEVLACNGQEELRSRWSQMQERQSWMSRGTYDDYQLILSNRCTLFGVLTKNQQLLKQMGIGMKDGRSVEIKALLDASRFARQHGQLQQALVATSQCNDLLENSKDVVFRAEVAVKAETASVLWDMGEITASVNMLHAACDLLNVESQDIPVGRPGLLAQLAHQLAAARLEEPDEILGKYLKPAIVQLQGQNDGREAGTVFHEFATFCDRQLQNPNNIEDFNRISKLRQGKLDELEGLQKLSKSMSRSGTGNDDHSKSISKAKQWYDIDNANYERLKRNRDTFMEQSLQNYLLALRASDEHDLSILRFFTLWLENADVAAANKIVGKYLPNVPSWKFVVLVNQLMSRLELDDSAFQIALKTLVTRLCSEHPHHSLHHLFTATRRPSARDEAAISRYKVASDIRQLVQKGPKAGQLLERIFKANNYYSAFAKKEADKTMANKCNARDFAEAHALIKNVPALHVPPPTITIPLQPDGNYTDVPEITKFGGTISFMSGISRPKKLTAYASDGGVYIQLFKGPPGKDDLRQDAIMEQVFAEVSKMLQNHKATRQRNLHVRTYKVIPLSTATGIIEFVPHSTSLTEFLMPAHERYHPQDYKNKTAREKIETARSHSTETRVKEYLKVCDHLHPVLRHFFFERFKDPDEWFEKRTAYTRTTATISILGYVLGLGDRHCQNIMLDEKTGEVVHIDLGVAFEAGRVLPVPELVPFRLSRDVVDGMGITKTEGVFRRCCEFTMDALREDKDSIMTLLNVLRYDPLYTWTVSPLRAKRIQEATGRTAEEVDVPEGSSKKKDQEAGEADRALSIVEKKLSTTLSTAATVNELIQQATDVRNLATLFSGWSAYF